MKKLALRLLIVAVYSACAGIIYKVFFSREAREKRASWTDSLGASLRRQTQMAASYEDPLTGEIFYNKTEAEEHAQGVDAHLRHQAHLAANPKPAPKKEA